jgi:NAD(P)H-hydrate repair Nnr-like enzyme with NAD(P)H-hydrate epimerase domain
MIKKLWVKFNGMDVECVCNENNRKCRDKQCREYVVKFTEIKRQKEIPKLGKEQQKVIDAIKGLNKSGTELTKTMKKFRRFRIH